MKKYLFIIFALTIFAGLSERSYANDIIYLDYELVATQSKAGISLREQSVKLTEELQKERDELQKIVEEKNKKFQDERSLLSPDLAKEREEELIKEFQELQDNFNIRAQKVQQAVTKANASIDSVLRPIMDEIVNEKGAKMLFERRSFLAVDPKLNITGEVIKILNKRLPKVLVSVDKD